MDHPKVPDSTSTQHPGKKPRAGPVMTSDSHSDLGYRGRFALWDPSHVILESLEGMKFSISKAIVRQSSKFFDEMFNLHAVGNTSHEPIQTLLPTKELFTFLLVVQDKEAIWDLWLGEKLALLELAARFECEAITINVNRLLEYHYAKSTVADLLIEASNLNLVPIAKIAIAKIDINQFADRYSCAPDWETCMKYLRSTWQTRLTKLLWETQTVDQPRHKRKRNLEGRLIPLKPDKVIVRTKKTYKEIAAAFNPRSKGE